MNNRSRDTRSRAPIIGIGLSRTGTLSLKRALEMLGLRAHHWPHSPETFEQLKRGDYRLRVLEEYDAVLDTPMPAFFRELDRVYLEAKFILTTRQVEDWLNSCEFLFARFPPDLSNPSIVFELESVYGCTYFCRKRFAEVYDRHHAAVAEHFAGRSDKLLTIDITAGAGWPELASFLGVREPEEEFPHLHRREAMTGRIPFLERTLRKYPALRRAAADRGQR